MQVDETALRRENAQLRERERWLSIQLDAANRTLESFSLSLSHDLRAPLRAVDSLIQILEEDHGDRLGEDGCRVLNVIHGACGTLDTLITALLAFARAVQQDLDLIQIDMAALVQEAVQQVMSGYSGLTPEVAIGEMPVCTGDALLLRQAWCELISNALKFSSQRQQPKIVVNGLIVGSEAIYQVEDKGAGFDMKNAHKLFGLFQRLHKADDFPGTGVGLAIVQKIIARHGGRIWAEGTVDVGACFQFALPIAVKLSQ